MGFRVSLPPHQKEFHITAILWLIITGGIDDYFAFIDDLGLGASRHGPRDAHIATRCAAKMPSSPPS